MLNALVQRHGVDTSVYQCTVCTNTTAQYLCKTCGPECWLCSSCMTDTHITTVGHQLFASSKSRANRVLGLMPFYVDNVSTLCELQSCHVKNDHDSSGVLGRKNVLLVDFVRSQNVSMLHCGCRSIGEQLTSLGYWPDRPVKCRVAFSVDLMEHYLSLCKFAQLGAFNFCQVLRGR